jgi:hypothetical protein
MGSAFASESIRVTSCLATIRIESSYAVACIVARPFLMKLCAVVHNPPRRRPAVRCRTVSLACCVRDTRLMPSRSWATPRVAVFKPAT